MKITELAYYVQVLEEGRIKQVPHDSGKNYKFPDKATAVSFLNQLRANNPDTMFRLVCDRNECTTWEWNRIKESITSKQR